MLAYSKALVTVLAFDPDVVLRFLVVPVALYLLTVTKVEAGENKINGVEPYAVFITDIFSNRSGGLATGTSTFALLDIGIDANLEKLVNWKGATFHIGGFWARGDDPSVDVGDFNALSNIVMPEGERLFEVWMQKNLGDDQGWFKTGMLGYDGDFQGSEHSAPFINSGFGLLPTISGNMPVPIFPQAAPGVVLQYSTNKTSYLQVGIYDGDAGSHERGTQIDLDSAQGAAVAVEAIIETGNKLKGIYKAGAIYHTGEFTDIRNGSIVDSNSSFYVIGDQVITSSDNGNPEVAGFFRIGYSPKSERNSVSSYIEAGINLFEPFQDRKNDLVGIGMFFTDFSDDFIDDMVATGSVANNAESVLEIFYQAEISSWLIVKPDIQYIKDPLFSEEATVVGIRIEGSF